MTHITQEQARELANSDALGSMRYGPEYIYDLCNLAIDHYLSTLSAELPEPVHHIMSDGQSIGYYSRDQLAQALAARDAKWQGFEQDYLDKCKELDILQAERDAALAKAELLGNRNNALADRLDDALKEAQKQAGLAAAWKLTHAAVLKGAV